MNYQVKCKSCKEIFATDNEDIYNCEDSVCNECSEKEKKKEEGKHE